VHAHAVHRAGGVLAAVAGSGAASSHAARERLNATRAATAEDIVHADDVEVVHVCTPNHLHRDLVLAALASGKHVVCEKPLAMNHAEVSAVLAAAREHDVFLMEAFMYRFHPQWQTLWSSFYSHD